MTREIFACKVSQLRYLQWSNTVSALEWGGGYKYQMFKYKKVDPLSESVLRISEVSAFHHFITSFLSSLFQLFLLIISISANFSLNPISSVTFRNQNQKMLHIHTQLKYTESPPP